MTTISKHTIHLLSKQEVEDIYEIPQLTYQEKKIIFSLNSQEKKVFADLRVMPSKLLFILQLGLFRLKKRFYSLERLNKEEKKKKYILKRYFPTYSDQESLLKLTKPTVILHQSKILKLFNYRKYEGDFVLKEVEGKARELARIHAKPNYIIRELVRFLTHKKIITPAYSTLHNLIGMVVQKEMDSLSQKLDSSLSEKQKETLDKLVKKRKNFLHELTCLKRTPKHFGLNEVLLTIHKQEKLEEVQSNIPLCIQNLGISKHNLLHCAQLVAYYTIYKIARMPILKRRLLLFCFIHVRYKMMNDYLIKAFLYRINKYIKDVKQVVIKRTYENRISHKKNNKLGKILLLLIDEMFLPGHISLDKARKSLFSILNKEELNVLGHSLIAGSSDEKLLEWEQFEKMKKKIRTNLRPLVLAIEFEAQPSSLHLVEAINVLKRKLKKGLFPKKVIEPNLFSKSVSKHVYPKKNSLKLRYEIQLYITIAKKINSGDIFIKDSLSYRSFEKDIIERNYWNDKKEEIIASLDLPKLKTPLKVLLSSLEKELRELYESVNERILRGENLYVEWNEKKRKWKFRVVQEKAEKQQKVNILDNIPPIGLSTLLNFVNSQTCFTNEFTHVLGHHIGNKSISALLATITACATNIGISKMDRNANVKFEKMQQVYKDFLRPDTLKRACDMISDKIKELSIFPEWNIGNGRVYSSSDGQKFGVSRQTYNARYSSKYFGCEKGIVSYTLESNYLPINSRIIGANEHESHFVLDILLDNTSEVRPDIHTTDSHGSNRINFSLLYLFDYVFAPRYRSPFEMIKKIYTFPNIKKNANYAFSPCGVIDTKIIQQEWDDILRIAASLAIKTTSQSTIVRKLSAFPRRNSTYKAFGELNKIIRSIHMLRYIDEVEFRQNIQKSLNRLESYHSLKRAIFYDNKGKFHVKSEVDQKIWSDCTRLLALNIIYYNSFIFSKIAERHLKLGKKIDFLKHASPIQWRHVDMYGHFYFGDTPNESEIREVRKAIKNLEFS